MEEILNHDSTRATLRLWAKASKDGDGRWHPLILHMLDVAASAEAILKREPESTRKRMAAILGLDWEEAQAWLLFLVACHDLGKACPGFQCKWENMSGLDSGRSPNTNINHAFVSQIALTELLQDMGWPDDLAELVSDAVGCHHGNRASPNTIEHLMGNWRAIGKDDWTQARGGLVEALLEVLKPNTKPSKPTLSGPDFMLLAGLTSFADWIGSNEDWFPFGRPEDCDDLHGWFQKRKACAEQALHEIGWESRSPLSQEPKSFEQVFPFPPRPLQQAVAAALIDFQTPAILLVEAPMGEGKTEAAFFAHLELQRRFGHRGLYVALPTKATGNAMFERTLKFLRGQGTTRTLDLQLLHGGKGNPSSKCFLFRPAHYNRQLLPRLSIFRHLPSCWWKLRWVRGKPKPHSLHIWNCNDVSDTVVCMLLYRRRPQVTPCSSAP